MATQVSNKTSGPHSHTCDVAFCQIVFNKDSSYLSIIHTTQHQL